jgi:alkaline phosphatase D
VPPVAVPEPPPPSFPPTVGVLSVGLRLAKTPSAGSNDPYEVCLNDTNCFRLTKPGLDDYRAGEFDRYHINVNLPRSAVDRITFRPVPPMSGATRTDAIRIDCLDMRFDGEPVYCADNLNQLVGLGNSAGEEPRYRELAPLMNKCVSCERETGLGVATTGQKLVGGPQLGPPEAAKIRMKVRTDATRKVGLFLSTNAGGTDEVPVAWAYPKPQDDFAVTLESQSPLAPNQGYFYRVAVDNDIRTARFPVQTAKTAASKFRFAMGSCARPVQDPPTFNVPSYGPIASSSPDLFLFLGDNHYGNTRFLDAHRHWYRVLERNAPRSSLLSRVPSIATWDDHDFVENNSDGLCGGRSAALKGFQEHWANGQFGVPSNRGTYSKQSYGAVDYFTLDCRSYRPRVTDTARRCEGADEANPGISEAAGLLGEAQFQWLLAGLSQSQAPFKFISCGSLFTAPDNYVDSWSSFPAARTRLFNEFATRGIKGIVFGSGDIHRSEFRRLPRANGYALTELVSSGLSQTNPSDCVANAWAANRLNCYSGNSYILVDVDGTVVDPTLTATIFSEAGVAQGAPLLIRSSNLQ